MKKNEEYVVRIVDNGFEGEGIAKIAGQTIFVPGSLKGEKVKIKILKVTTKIAYAKVLEILEKSEHRRLTDCATDSQCGGCSLRHIDYDYTLQMKKNSVENTLKKALGREVLVDEIIPMDEPFYYRNKLQYPLGVSENGELTMGVFAKRSHKIIPTKHCQIQNELAQRMVNDIFAFAKEHKISGYDEKSQTGILRHIVVRVGVKTNEAMVTLVVNDFKLPKEKELVDFLTSRYPEMKTIVKNLNDKNTNVILGTKNKVIFGDGYITDILLGKKFKISNLSFYQVNPVQTEKLYAKAIEYAALTRNETIFDLYCGIGTIGICAADKAKQLFGMETIPEAISDAKENARLNHIKNSEFFVGDVEKTLPAFVQERNVNPDVVFVDPPRKGCDKTALETLLKMVPKRIVYVSCNPATLGRDLKMLEEKYALKKLAICEMFPWTRTRRMHSDASIERKILKNKMAKNRNALKGISFLIKEVVKFMKKIETRRQCYRI